MAMKPVTERDFRMPEFKDANPEDYELRDDGTIARKDRWEMAVRSIGTALGIGAREKWEISDVVDRFRKMLGSRYLNGAFSVGANKIAEERGRQVVAEGWTVEHDDDHCAGELSAAADCYLLAAKRRFEGLKVSTTPPTSWPWSIEWWKPSPDPVRNLVKAGALIAAEIDREERWRQRQVQP